MYKKQRIISLALVFCLSGAAAQLRAMDAAAVADAQAAHQRNIAREHPLVLDANGDVYCSKHGYGRTTIAWHQSLNLGTCVLASLSAFRYGSSVLNQILNIFSDSQRTRNVTKMGIRAVTDVTDTKHTPAHAYSRWSFWTSALCCSVGSAIATYCYKSYQLKTELLKNYEEFNNRRLEACGYVVEPPENGQEA